MLNKKLILENNSTNFNKIIFILILILFSSQEMYAINDSNQELLKEESKVKNFTIKNEIYKIMTTKEWELFQNNGYFEGSQIDKADGFIHAAFKEQYPNIIKKYFKGISPLFLVKIDTKLLPEDSLKVESNKSRGNKYPHVYSSIPLKAVVSYEIID